MIEKALEEDITISKMPPDVTDKIQPLDVSSFGSLKRAWTELLNERVNVLGPKEILSKSKFVNLLCQVWYTGLSTEIFPTNRDKYNFKRLDQRSFNYYQHWIDLGNQMTLMQKLKQTVRLIMSNSIKILRKKTKTILQPTQYLWKTKVLLMVVALVKR